MTSHWEIEDIKKVTKEARDEAGSVHAAGFGKILEKHLRRYYKRRKELEK
jgi:hypothetical protein